MHSPSSAVACRHRTLLAVFVAVYFGIICWRPEIMSLFGIGNLGIWFLDTHALLAASDAYALGLDPYGNNPLDLFHQPHVYSYWWFGLDSLGLTRHDHVWLGALLGFIFLGVALFQVRVRTEGETLWATAIIAAPPMVLGFNRANADLFVFILLSAAVPCLLSRRRVLRWLAMASLLLAATLKFYPAAAGVVLLAVARPPRAILWKLVIYCGLLLLLAFDQAQDIRRATDQLHPEGFFTFGLGVTPQLLDAPAWTTALLALALGGGATAYWWRKAPTWTVPAADRADYVRFLLGAVLLVGCYFATVNYAYRSVFAIWMVSFLWSVCTTPGWPAWFRRLGRVTSGLLLIFLWLDGLLCFAINLSQQFTRDEVNRWTDRFVLAQQPVTAALMAALLGFIVPFVRDSLRHLNAHRRQAVTVPS